MKLASSTGFRRLAARSSRTPRARFGESFVDSGRHPQGLVQPIERPTIDQRAIVHLAVLPGSFSDGEADELLPAAQLLEESPGRGPQRIVFGKGEQRRAADELDATLHGKRLNRVQIAFEAVDAVHPETALDDLPALPAVLFELTLELLERRRRELDARRRLGQEAGTLPAGPQCAGSAMSAARRGSPEVPRGAR